MKSILLLIVVVAYLNSFAQQKEFYLQGQVVDENKNPIGDAYIFNERSSVKTVSRTSGIFDIRVLPEDSVIITHISFIRKVVTVYQLLSNPIVQLELDTINIRPVNVSADKMSEYNKAMENIDRIEFDFRPQPDDTYTETERMKNLLITENQVERAYSHSLNFLQFSPSEEIGKLISKRKKRKEAKQFSSTKEIEPEEKK
jgi:hypothetical protein